MNSAIAVEVLDATVFVGCPAGHEDLAEVVAGIFAHDPSARPVHTAVVMAPNEDADPDRAAQWPGGFLFFPCVLEIFAGHAPRRDRADVIALLLSTLWSKGIAAVAACEYEDLLPAAAGMGDRTLPWPITRR